MTDQTDAQQALAALQTLTALGLGAAQIVALLNAPERTLEQVQAQLDATDAAIQNAFEGDNHVA